MIQYGDHAGPLDTDGHTQAVCFGSKDHGADASDIAPTLRAGGHSKSRANAGVPPAIAFSVRGREGGAQAEAHEAISALRSASGGSTRDYVAFDTTQITSKANRSNPRAGDPCHPLAAGAHAPTIAWNITPSQSNTDYKARPASYAQALTGAGNRPSARGGDLIGSSAVRRLTPTECERLQGFKDGYTDVPYRGKPAADGPRYKALGNSMAVPVMAWIGRHIALVNGLMP